MKTELLSLIKKAMLSKNEVELRVLRLIKTEFMNFETAKNATELTPVKEIEILNKMIKQRKDSVEKYKEAHRFDLAEQEEKEIEIIEKFLPSKPTDEELTAYAKEVISKGDGNMGSYINAIKLKFPSADGKTVANIVKENLK